MLAEAPQLLIALEQSALGAAIRQSTWAYPAANVGHILALTLFAGGVAAMDTRLLGAFAAGPAGEHRATGAARGDAWPAAHGPDRIGAVHGRGQPCRHEPSVPGSRRP
jgi:hypothetical protein